MEIHRTTASAHFPLVPEAVDWSSFIEERQILHHGNDAIAGQIDAQQGQRE